MCGPFFWGVWWIVPLIGFSMCLAFMAVRLLGAGRGFMCMGSRGHRPAETDRQAESHQ
jgi:hypothetical protein